jgi:hypothetical protein
MFICLKKQGILSAVPMPLMYKNIKAQALYSEN